MLCGYIVLIDLCDAHRTPDQISLLSEGKFQAIKQYFLLGFCSFFLNFAYGRGFRNKVVAQIVQISVGIVVSGCTNCSSRVTTESLFRVCKQLHNYRAQVSASSGRFLQMLVFYFEDSE